MGPGQNQPDSKNLILAFAISMMILLGFQVFYAGPQQEAEMKARQAQQAQLEKSQAATPGAAPATTAAPGAAGVPAPGTATTPAITGPLPLAQALALSPRVAVEAGAVRGSIALRGARFDDLALLRYMDDVGSTTPVRVLQPQFHEHGQYAIFGWRGAAGGTVATPGPDTLWTAPAGAKLTPATPLVLTWNNGAGLTFTRTITVDNDYMFTVSDRVDNTSAGAVSLQQYGLLNRHRAESDRVDPVNHQGAVSLFDNRLKKTSYKDIEDGKGQEIPTATGGWVGFKDRYWIATLVPDQRSQLTAEVKTQLQADGLAYQAAFASQPVQIGAGRALTTTQHFYAGGKVRNILERYEGQFGITRFDDAIDWGMLKAITKPLHWLLAWFNSQINNIGLSILALTVVVKLATFPLVYTSYRSFAKLRDVAPKMKEIQTKFAADKTRQQQEMIKLYQTEKINPVAGCIPILLQMPIFFALYKMLSNAIELRHAPFYGWIQDLSAKDPTTIFNLFGLLPFDPTSWPLIGGLLAIGAWPILYGCSFWLLQKMQPSQITDPIQQKIFAIMPWLFVIIFAGFSAGLVIYYTWSNLLTIIQQYAIAKSMKTSTPIDEFFAKLGKPKAKA